MKNKLYYNNLLTYLNAVSAILLENDVPIESEPDIQQDSDYNNDLNELESDNNMSDQHDSSSDNEHNEEIEPPSRRTNQLAIIQRSLSSRQDLLDTMLRNRNIYSDDSLCIALLLSHTMSLFTMMLFLDMLSSSDSDESTDTDGENSNDNDSEISRFEELISDEDNDNNNSGHSDNSESSDLPDNSQFNNYNHTQNNSSVSNPTPIENDITINSDDSIEIVRDINESQSQINVVEYTDDNANCENYLYEINAESCDTTTEHIYNNSVIVLNPVNVVNSDIDYCPGDENQMDYIEPEYEQNVELEEEYLYEEVEYLDEDTLLETENQIQTFTSSNNINFMDTTELFHDNNSCTTEYLNSDCVSFEESDYSLICSQQLQLSNV